MQYSITALVNNSVFQLVYLQRHNKKIIAIDNKIKKAINNQISIDVNSILNEMGGYLAIKNCLKKELITTSIAFAIDEVQTDLTTTENTIVKLIKYKKPINENSIPDWYLKRSIIETALQGALVLKTNEKKKERLNYVYNEIFCLFNKSYRLRYLNKYLEIKEGIQKYKEKAKNEIIENLLVFINTDNEKIKTYIVEPSREVLNFYYEKAECAASNKYKKAKSFDLAYKHKEWDLLGNCIRYKEI